MSDPFATLFGDAGERFFPGSRHKIPEPVHANAPNPDWMDRHKAKSLSVQGEVRDFYDISALADALNRHPGSVRRWMVEKSMPEARYRNRQNRRLWTADQINGIVLAAKKHGLFSRKSLHTAGIPQEFTDEVLTILTGDT